MHERLEGPLAVLAEGDELVVLGVLGKVGEGLGQALLHDLVQADQQPVRVVVLQVQVRAQRGDVPEVILCLARVASTTRPARAPAPGLQRLGEAVDQLRNVAPAPVVAGGLARLVQPSHRSAKSRTIFLFFSWPLSCGEGKTRGTFAIERIVSLSLRS